MTKLLIFSSMDPWSASTRYRASQHVPRLRHHFESVAISYPNDTAVRHPGRLNRIRYFGTHSRRYVRRGMTVARRVQSADALFVQRGLYVMGPGAIVHPIEAFAGRVVFDLDDALFRLSPSLATKSRTARWLYGPHQALRLLRRADAIVVSTEVLANMLPRGLPEPTILPTVPDPLDYPLAARDPGAPVVVGWAGTVGGLGYLDALRTVFQRLKAEGLATVEVVSSRPWSGPASFHPWRLDESISVFDRFSIGIMPLPDTDYTRAKAGFKLLQYMASGIPVVSSPVGVNRELITRSGAGYLADAPGEWEDALRSLAADPDLRVEMGRKGRAFVEGYADLRSQTQRLVQLLTGTNQPTGA
jgi:glycosyltransferase involved in cell wall biosynthesis